MEYFNLVQRRQSGYYWSKLRWLKEYIFQEKRQGRSALGERSKEIVKFIKTKDNTALATCVMLLFSSCVSLLFAATKSQYRLLATYFSTFLAEEQSLYLHSKSYVFISALKLRPILFGNCPCLPFPKTCPISNVLVCTVSLSSLPLSITFFLISFFFFLLMHHLFVAIHIHGLTENSLVIFSQRKLGNAADSTEKRPVYAGPCTSRVLHRVLKSAPQGAMLHLVVQQTGKGCRIRLRTLKTCASMKTYFSFPSILVIVQLPEIRVASIFSAQYS